MTDKRVLIVANERDDAVAAAVCAIRAHFGDSLQIINGTTRQADAAADAPAVGDAALCDLVLALGGDGTILRAARRMLADDIASPLLGIKFGRLGFLSGAPAAELLPALDAALAGTATIEERTVLAIEVRDATGTLRARHAALNEAFLGRADLPGPVTTALAINDHDIYTQTGDGVIVATATGSTAYALAAGGPVVASGYAGMVVVPVASHTLVQRAIVTAPDDSVTLRLPDALRAHAALVIDGAETLRFAAPATDTIHIRRDPARSIRLVKTSSRLFFDTLAREFFGSRGD
ncbi:MAG: NAD(+)/NADH kinase [Actinomycetes bacterium]|jgi:NAD+ kinase|nr:NAD(+)/NADH kinase [Actinomycetes bacterium]